MLAGLEQLGGRAGGEDGADGQSAAETLGEGHHVGGDARCLVGEEAAGTGDAGLDLVEHEQCTAFGGDATRAGEITLGRDDDAGLAMIGSRKTAAVFSSTAASRASRSP